MNTNKNDVGVGCDALFGWVKTADRLPCEVGEQADILMWSPEWATWLKGMVTRWADGCEWAIYNQQDDRYLEWEHVPEFWMSPILPNILAHPCGTQMSENQTAGLPASDVASCSESSFMGSGAMIEVYDPELGESQSVVYNFVKDRGTLKEGSMVIAFLCITATDLVKHRALIDEILEKHPVNVSGHAQQKPHQ